MLRAARPASATGRKPPGGGTGPGPSSKTPGSAPWAPRPKAQANWTPRPAPP